jgi:hypothetical protein
MWTSALLRQFDLGIPQHLLKHRNARSVASVVLVDRQAGADVLVIDATVFAAAALASVRLILARQRLAIGHVLGLRRRGNDRREGETGDQADACDFDGSLLSIEESVDRCPKWRREVRGSTMPVEQALQTWEDVEDFQRKYADNCLTVAKMTYRRLTRCAA